MVANWLKFGLTAEQEDRFRQASLKSDIALARMTILIIIPVLVAFTFNDYAFFGLTRLFYGILTLRFLLIFYTILFLSRLGRFTSYRSYDRAEFIWGLCFAAFVLIISATRPHAFIAHSIVVVFAVFITVFAVPNRFRNQIIISFAYIIGETLIIAPHIESSPQTFVTALLTMCGANFIAILGGQPLHSLRRKEFLAREEAENVKLESLEQIKELKRGEEAIQASEAKFRNLFKTMKEGFSTYELLYDETGKVYDLCYEEVNPAYEQQTGLEIKDVLGRSPLDIFRNIQPEWVERYMNVANTGESAHFEAWFGPLERWFDVSVYKIDPKRMAAVFFNITERKLAEEALKKAYDELDIRIQERTAELRNAMGDLELRNRELQDFAFVASHDLREPLRKIQIFGAMIKDRFAVDLPDQARDYFTRMQNAANRMDQLLSALLRYSRISRQHEPFVAADLNVLVREAASDLAIIEEKGANVLVGELPVLDVDPSQIRQLFGNLIQNAVKFNVSSCPEIKIHAEVNDGLCRIYVEDNGIGFEEQYLDKIFSPFQRLHRRDEYEGMGMGLAICQKIVEMHGGHITASSRPGEGATFIISLPMKH